MNDNMLIYIVVIIFIIGVIRVVPLHWILPKRKSLEYFIGGLETKKPKVKNAKWLSQKILGLNYTNKGNEMLNHLVFSNAETKSHNIYNTE